MSRPSLKVVVAVTSPIAFNLINSHSVLQACIQKTVGFVESYGPTAQLVVAGTAQDLQAVDGLPTLICDPHSPHSFAQAISQSAVTDLVMIHDSQRALTSSAQFDRVVQGLTEQIDAVRPVSAFTETLKSVSADGFIQATIDRSSMARLSTPELIRFCAIDFQATTSNWFLPLTADARTATVDADADSARINSVNEIALMRVLQGL